MFRTQVFAGALESTNAVKLVSQMPERTIVTGGDSGYFPLIDELCASARAFRTADQLGLAVVNAGLSSHQLDHLNRRYDARIIEFDWGFDIARVRAGTEALKTQFVRPFLDRCLPDSELIGWLDADTWIQDISVVDMMFDEASSGDLVIVSEASRYVDTMFDLRWGPFGLAQPRSMLYKSARRARLNNQDTRTLATKANLNAGVFVLRRESPYWEVWRGRLGDIVRHGKLFTSDQLSLAAAVYLDGVSTKLAPDICNYRGPWLCDAMARTLVEAYMPHDKVGIVHLAGLNEIRRDRAATIEIPSMDGKIFRKSLRWVAWRDTI